MFNFFGYRNMYKNNAQTISRAAEKMKNNLLLIEDILDEEDLVNDLKSPSFSQLISYLSTDKMKKLLDYILEEPASDAEKKYYSKFPYFACEVLCSENVFLLEKYFEDSNKMEGGDEDQSIEHEETEQKVTRCPKRSPQKDSPKKSKETSEDADNENEQSGENKENTEHHEDKEHEKKEEERKEGVEEVEKLEVTEKKGKINNSSILIL